MAVGDRCAADRVDPSLSRLTRCAFSSATQRVAASHVGYFLYNLVKQADVLRVSVVQYLVCGLLSTTLGLVFEFDTLGGLSEAWWAVVYGGVFSVGVGFTFQALGQKFAPAPDAAILLSTESVFAALFGWLFLGELLTGLQVGGCALMLAGAVLAQAPNWVHNRARKEPATDRPKLLSR
jgi:drug/metabolite transporter (DMT)-like permease